jgi:hypothetical protein
LGFYFAVETVPDIAAGVLDSGSGPGPIGNPTSCYLLFLSARAALFGKALSIFYPYHLEFSDARDNSIAYPSAGIGGSNRPSFHIRRTGVRRASSVSLKILYRALLRLCGFAGFERAQIAAPACLCVFLA